MAAALPIELASSGQKQAWIARELTRLTREERAKYESDAFFRGMIDTCLEQDWRSPEGAELAREARAAYGDDFERRLADLDAGAHPYQQPR